MKIKKTAAAVISLMLMCGITGCSDEPAVITLNEKTNISFSWWGNDKRNEYTIQAIREFERLNPDIDVKCIYSEWSGYQVRSNVQMASNTEADVMQINFAWVEQYSPDGTGYYDISTLSDYIDLSNFTENELNYGMKNGRLNALPIALNTQTLYINKTVYDRYGLDIPTEWEDFFEAAKVMKDDCYPVSANNKAALFILVAYAEQLSGHEFLKSDGTLGFDENDFKVMLEFYSRLINENVIPQVEYFERINLDSGEYAGTFAWLSDASSYLGNAIKNGNEIIIADYTSLDGADGLGWYTKPATMYAISSNTNYPEESARLLDFLLNSDEMAEFQGVEKGIPISKSARTYLENAGKLTGIQYEAFVKMDGNSDKMKVISPFMENTTILDLVQASMNSVYFEKTTAEEEAASLKAEIEKVLSK